MRASLRLGVLAGLVALVAASVLAMLRPAGGGAEGAERGEEAASDESSRPGLAAASPRAREAARRSGSCSIAGVVLRQSKGATARVEARLRVPYAFGRAAAGATARLTERAIASGLNRPDAGTDAAEDGRFALDGLEPGEWDLTARCDGHVAYNVVTLARDGSRGATTLHLVSGDLVLEVHARRADGTPWRARVTTDSAVGIDAVTTDERGVAMLGGFWRGSFAVLVSDDVLRVGWTSVDVPRDGPFVVTAPATGVYLTGRVVEATNGGAIAGANVSTCFDAAGEVWAVVPSSADGSFRLPASPATSWLQATAPGFVGRIAYLKGEASGIELALPRTSRIAGTVLDAATRRPIANVRVLAGPCDGDGWGSPISDRLREDAGSGVSDSQGRFSFEVVGSHDVVVSAMGAGWWVKGLVERDRHGPGRYALAVTPGRTAEIEIEVEAAARIEGAVVDAEGRTVEGATVRVEEGGWGAERRRLNPGGVPEATARETSGVGGDFAFDTVLPGVPLRVVATLHGVESEPVETAALLPGQSGRVRLSIPKPRRLVVHVVREVDSAPVAGAGVAVAQVHAPPAVTDRTGVARFDHVPSGGLRVSAWTDSLQGESTDAEAKEDGEFSATIRLRPRLDGNVPKLGTISGVVRWPDGTPAAGAAVGFGDTELDPNTSLAPAPADAYAAADGTFTLASVSLSPRRVVATAWRLGVGWGAAAEAAPGNEPLALVLREGRADAVRWRMRVLLPDGSPVPAADADLRVEGAAPLFSWEIVDGAIDRGLDPRRAVTLVVRRVRRKDGTPIDVLPAVLGPVAPAALPAEVRLRPARTIEGRVVGPEGVPLPGIVVEVRPLAPAGEEPAASARFGDLPPLSKARSGADGTFLLREIDDAEYRLSAALPAAYVDSGSARVRGGDTGVIVRVRPAVGCTVRVVDEDGAGVFGVHLGLTASTGGPVAPGAAPSSWFSADAKGVAVLPRLDPEARYALSVHVYADDPFDASWPRRGVRFLPYRNPEWKPGDVTIRLERPPGLRGAVRTADGVPVAHALVSWRREEDHGEVRADEAGRFSVWCDAAGDVELTASFGRADPDGPVARTRVPTGTRDLTLTLDVGAELALRLDPPWQDTEASVKVARDGGEGHWDVCQDVANGVLRFRGLRRDRTYTAWMSGAAVVFASGLVPSGSVHVLRRVPAKAVLVRVPEVSNEWTIDVFARRGPVTEVASRGSERRFEWRLDGLALGRWQIEVRGRDPDGTAYEGRAEVEAGGEVEVALRRTKE